MTTDISLYNSIPGLTDLSDYNIDNGSYLTSLKGCNNNEKDVILLACNDITENNLFLNGLNQNIIIFYELFESLGYSCYLIQHSNSPSDKDKYLNKYKVILPDNIIRNPLPIKWYIEIGMSLDAVTRSYIRSIGAKIVKIYLGNILNIDIETIQNYKSMMFG